MRRSGCPGSGAQAGLERKTRRARCTPSGAPGRGPGRSRSPAVAARSDRRPSAPQPACQSPPYSWFHSLGTQICCAHSRREAAHRLTAFTCSREELWSLQRALAVRRDVRVDACCLVRKCAVRPRPGTNRLLLTPVAADTTPAEGRRWHRRRRSPRVRQAAVRRCVVCHRVRWWTGACWHLGRLRPPPRGPGRHGGGGARVPSASRAFSARDLHAELLSVPRACSPRRLAWRHLRLSRSS